MEGFTMIYDPQQRIADLERQLADANYRYVLLTDELWHIFGEQDRRDYAVQAKDIMQELAEAQKAAQWQKITPDNLPEVGDIVGCFVYNQYAPNGYCYDINIALFSWKNLRSLLESKYTHFIRHNPPAQDSATRRGRVQRAQWARA